ncbi:MAG: hypothetical protein LBU15_02440 [Rickettsiales bacterium]|jgi:DNA polymerase-3 subunit delta'|nr:hypothetical protein [Rickettsiales bacterium]
MAGLYGFGGIWEGLVRDLRNRRLHHCYLLNGRRGIGKSCFLQRVASLLLSVRDGREEPTDLDLERTDRLIRAGGHTDLVMLNMATPEDDGSENTSRREEINVRQVRKVIRDLRLTQSISKNRVMIVDSIDSVNVNGQNALLKTLEEPPANTYLFLLCHSGHRVLDTVRSRCTVINVPDLTFEDWSMALGDACAEPPEGEALDLRDLYDLAGHSVGLALEIISNRAQNLYSDLLDSIFGGNPLEIQKFAERMSSVGLFSLFGVFLDRFFSDILSYWRNGLLTFGERHRDRAASFLGKNDLAMILKKYDYSRKIVRDMETYSLDKKHCLSVLLRGLGSDREL